MGTGIVFVIVAAIFYFSGKKLAQKLYQTTGYYAYGKLNLFLAATVGLPVILAFINGYEIDRKALLVFIGLACIPLAILTVRNLKLKNPVAIIAMTFIQVLAGGIAAFALFSIFALRIAGVNIGGSVDNYNKGYKQGTATNPVDPLPHTMTQDQQEGFTQGRKDRGF